MITIMQPLATVASLHELKFLLDSGTFGFQIVPSVMDDGRRSCSKTVADSFYRTSWSSSYSKTLLLQHLRVEGVGQRLALAPPSVAHDPRHDLEIKCLASLLCIVGKGVAPPRAACCDLLDR